MENTGQENDGFSERRKQPYKSPFERAYELGAYPSGPPEEVDRIRKISDRLASQDGLRADETPDLIMEEIERSAEDGRRRQREPSLLNPLYWVYRAGNFLDKALKSYRSVE